MAWFTAGRWIEPPLANSYWFGWHGTQVFQKLDLPVVTGRMLTLDGWFVYEESDVTKVSDFALDKINRDPSWFNLFAKESEFACTELELIASKAAKMPLLEGWETFSKPMRELSTLWTLAYLQLDHGLNRAFAEHAKKTGVSEAQLAAAVKPRKQGRIVTQQQEAIALKRKILEVTSDLSSAKKVEETLQKQAPNLYKEVQIHLNKYPWVGVFHFYGDPLSFEKILKVELPESENAPAKEVEIPRNAEQLIEIASEVALWRQWLAESSGVGAYYMLNLFRQSAKQIGINENDYMYLAEFELVEALKTGNFFSQELVSLRKKANGLISEKGINARIIAGEELQQWLNKLVKSHENQVKELKGAIACPGKATGTAKILINPKDFQKMQQGDVLVAPETAPDFAPSMRKACAIVTDQGGVTSHAAIISRELGVPCIVGTKLATTILKDGDLIEVDATKGIIRKIR